MIQKPFTVDETMTLGELHGVMGERGVSGFPVVGADGKLSGMVTSRDIWGMEDASVVVRDFMTPRDRLVTAHKSTSLEDARKVLYENRIEKLPLVDDDGHARWADHQQGHRDPAESTPTPAKTRTDNLRVGGAVGVGEDYLDRARALKEAGADGLFIDAATGHTTRVMAVIEKLRSEFTEGTPVVAGNVVTQQGAKDSASPLALRR